MPLDAVWAFQNTFSNANRAMWTVCPGVGSCIKGADAAILALKNGVQ